MHNETVLVGARSIAAYVWGDEVFARRVYHYLETPGRIPVERDTWTGRLYASRSELDSWILDQLRTRSRPSRD